MDNFNRNHRTNIRYLKENNIYFKWLHYTMNSHGNYKNFINWYKDNKACPHFIMNSFSWGDCNRYYHDNVNWSYHYKNCILLAEEL